MNYRSFKITTKYILFITLIIVLVLMIVLKVTKVTEGIVLVGKKAMIDMETVTRGLQSIDGAKMIADLKSENKITMDGINQISTVLEQLDTLRFRYLGYLSAGKSSIDKYTEQINELTKKGNNPSELATLNTNRDQTVDRYNAIYEDYIKQSSTLTAKIREIMMNNIKKNGDEVKLPTPAEKSTNQTLKTLQPLVNKPKMLDIVQDAAPNYPDYKFKGCWASGNNTEYPILTQMVIPNVFNMNDCVQSISRAGLQTAAYDGKNLCLGGGPEYAEYTSYKCEDTYKKGNSWLVYSKSN